jgi:GNAT superfamily N-acetyltransferase
MASINNDVFPFVDLTLAQRLERAEAKSNASFVDARAQLFPDSGARWIEVGGAYAMFDGPTSPLTQTFGLGLFEATTAALLETLETFFRQCGAPVFHEVSPLASDATLALLNDRGYQPLEFTSILFRPLGVGVGPPIEGLNKGMRVRRAQDGEEELWAATAARGWGESKELADFMRTIGRVSARAAGTHTFFAEHEGRPIATAALNIWDGVAILAGASTIPEGRRQGAQLALLDERLRYARERGCGLAMMGARPGSGSQRNAERHGFRIAYTRVKWQLVRD